jgi:hypothetical protein
LLIFKLNGFPITVVVGSFFLKTYTHIPGNKWLALEEYQAHPWKHSGDILELANKQAAKSGSILSMIFNRKSEGTLVTLVGAH